MFSSRSFWTSSSLDVPAGVTQEEGHTEFLIHLLSVVHALIFLARRIQPFLSLVDHDVEFCKILCTNDLTGPLFPIGIQHLIYMKFFCCGSSYGLKKNQNTPRPSEHPPVMGEKMSKCLGGIKRLQIQNLFMAFKQVPRCR